MTHLRIVSKFSFLYLLKHLVLIACSLKAAGIIWVGAKFKVEYIIKWTPNTENLVECQVLQSGQRKGREHGNAVPRKKNFSNNLRWLPKFGNISKLSPKSLILSFVFVFHIWRISNKTWKDLRLHSIFKDCQIRHSLSCLHSIFEDSQIRNGKTIFMVYTMWPLMLNLWQSLTQWNIPFHKQMMIVWKFLHIVNKQKTKLMIMNWQFFGDFGLELWSRTLWTRTINSLKEFSRSNVPGPYFKCTCSRSMCLSNMVLEHFT